MPSVRISAHVALAALSCVCAVSHADSLRCQTKLALKGDTQLEVRAKCGEPHDVVRSTVLRQSTYSIGARHLASYTEGEAIVIPVETWTYNFGPHRFIYRLEFMNGVLTTVKTLGYGF